MTLMVPLGYQQTYVGIDWINNWLLEHHHPEYVRRVVNWIAFKNGEIGIGGAYRLVQPVGPTFAPVGKTFHMDQVFKSGFVGAAAVDIVKRDGPDDNFKHDSVAWSDVPKQGSADAKKWGIHANVSDEAWHIQPIEIDGWSSWVEGGRVDPVANYPIPNFIKDPVDLEPPSYVCTLPLPTLKLNSIGQTVKFLQDHIRFYGCDPGPSDGQYGPKTEAAVKCFQEKIGANPDGWYGPQTRKLACIHWENNPERIKHGW